jgi:hypothetical protein
MSRAGYSLIELTIVFGLLGTLAAVSMPSLLASRDDARAKSAADHVASLLHLARFEAVKRHVNVALRFGSDGEGVHYAMYVDGNGNGVRTADIDEGTDRPIREVEHIAQQCPGVAFAVEPGIVGIDGDEAPVDPIHLGRSQMVSFSPGGTSSSGTVFLLGRGRRQFAVRVLGPTGRIRTLEYQFASATWRPR